MTLIEGIGDEVIQFFSLLALVIVALIAWWSTNISERPLMRTVLILERRTRHATDSPTALADLTDSNELPSQASVPEVEEKTSQSDNDTNSAIGVNMAEHFDNIFVNREEIESIMPSFEGESKPSSQNQGTENKKNCTAPNEDSVIKNRNVNIFDSKEESSEMSEQNKCSPNLIDESSASGAFDSHSSTEGNIRIRLKYLNDDLQLVEGKLEEPLGDFKRRHFNLELSRKKLVRLIFNGKVLQQDSKTLQNYGFFDNCVVHCLVHQPRTPPPSPNLNRTQEVQNETPHYHWDLGNILFASLSFLLGLAWYGRYQYAQLYTATTTVALISLTGMFTVSLIGMYMPDVDGVRT